MSELGIFGSNDTLGGYPTLSRKQWRKLYRDYQNGEPSRWNQRSSASDMNTVAGRVPDTSQEDAGSTKTEPASRPGPEVHAPRPSSVAQAVGSAALDGVRQREQQPPSAVLQQGAEQPRERELVSV